ncbi:MAG: pyrroloquinoline quinone biosynthesis protein PqqE [Pseudomonadota bacterium]
MTPANPTAMLAELTHRCPLSCPYCSNPLELVRRDAELSTEQWVEVFRQAGELGVLHVHLSGGEPASRRDLEDLTEAAAEADLYTNLITSGVGLTAKRIAELARRGLEHVQLSIQGPTKAISDEIGGYAGGYERKMQVADWIAAEGLPLTVNAVMHRRNFERLEDTIDLAVKLGARRLEVATVQFHGWALRNQAALMPTRRQVEAAETIIDDARNRLRGVLVIDYVAADYFARFPKACMGGWGSVGLVVTPSGAVMPCHAADTIPHLVFENVRDRPLSEIWRNSDAFNAYRGVDWMQEPCRSCERREIDFGGCRCQAMALAGDAAATDPACEKSPLNEKLQADADAFSRGGDTLVHRANAPAY